MEKGKYVLGLLRLSMGFIFLWAFIDKLFGLSFSTAPDKSWLAGVSPTAGFLQFATHGPLAVFFQNLAGSGLIDWLFMLGLLFIGIALCIGIFVNLASTLGIVMLFLMYLAVGLSPANNPFIDDHLVYILIMFLFIFFDAGIYLGLGRRWNNTMLVKRYSIFK